MKPDHVKIVEKVLKENGLRWTNYFDIHAIGVKTKKFEIAQACEIIKTWLTMGR